MRFYPLSLLSRCLSKEAGVTHRASAGRLCVGRRPASITLVDVEAKHRHLVQLAERARQHYQFAGPVHITHPHGTQKRMPEEVYERCTLFLTATSVKHVVDVDRLLPGTSEITVHETGGASRRRT